MATGVIFNENLAKIASNTAQGPKVYIEGTPDTQNRQDGAEKDSTETSPEISWRIPMMVARRLRAFRTSGHGRPGGRTQLRRAEPTTKSVMICSHTERKRRCS